MFEIPNEHNHPELTKKINLLSEGPIKSVIQTLAWLKNQHVNDIIICPGGRNAPFVEVLSKTKLFNVNSYFEERSAGFYALGLTKKTNSPAVVITTSGTAVAELLPSVIEAHYQNLPLIVITADRPKSYRGSGAPQAIDQAQIFNSFCKNIYDFEQDVSSLFKCKKISGPVHINMCFDEPLLSGSLSEYDDDISFFASDNSFKHPFPKKEVKLKSDLETVKSILAIENKKAKINISNFKSPLVILGALSKKESDQILPTLVDLNLPVYAESHSQLKSNEQIKHLLLDCTPTEVLSLFESNICDSVVRIGGVPVLRFWRDLQKLTQIPVLNFSNTVFSGLPRLKQPSLVLEGVQHYVLELKNKSNITNLSFKKNNQLSKEQAFVKTLSQKLEGNAHIFLGNSLPIRHWDEVAVVKPDQVYTSMRGANGIDGNIAYFFGSCHEDKPNYCVIGDLTALYDLSSGFIYNQILKNIDFKIIIINNSGGKIFNTLFDNPLFENKHKLNFKNWAEMMNLGYQKISHLDEFKNGLNGQVIELEIENEK